MSDGDDAIGQSAPELGEDLRELLEKLSAQYNFDLREYKEVSLVRRIRARMTQVRAESVSAYSRLLDENAGEHVALINTILINVTGFFRDSEAWKVLAEHVVPRLVEDAADSRSLRIWSTGCSSGEEAYSIAILLAERLGAPAENYTIKIYGTDVDEEALTAARQAVYRTEQLKDVPDRLVDRYFTREGQLYRFRREFRRWCIFGSHNLTQAPPLSHIDLLVCRNALIYFTGELQDRILTRFHYSIREDGFLFLGRSESLLARSRLFTPVHQKWRIVGVLVYALEATEHARLKEQMSRSAEQHATAIEELQSTNEELETTNEELQSTNEELETTNEELQSTNEELETTVEELQVANAELGTLNAQLEARSSELKRLDAYHLGLLNSMEQSVFVTDRALVVTSWNQAAERMWGLRAGEATGRDLMALPLGDATRILRTPLETVSKRGVPVEVRDVPYTLPGGEVRTAVVKLAPLHEGGGELIGVIGIAAPSETPGAGGARRR